MLHSIDTFLTAIDPFITNAIFIIIIAHNVKQDRKIAALEQTVAKSEAR